ncbi:hypothetical protein Btru_057390 [Bulinus truncatus]|nr:hypothetical protein Btru_057390 [Bulinus truncatus]
MKRNLIFFVLTLTQVYLFDASHIGFTASPTVINPVLTKNLTLRCAVQDFISAAFPTTTSRTTWTTTSQRTTLPTTRTTSRYPWLDPTAAGTNVQADVAHVMSVIISRVSGFTGQVEVVAHVTPFESAAASDAFNRSTRVEGDSQRSSVNGERGYLQVTWDYPGEDEAGEYICEVFALNSDNHPVNLKSTLTVLSREPTISDLVKYIANHEKRFEEVKSMSIDNGSDTCSSTSNGNRVNFHKSFQRPPTVFTSFSDIRHTGGNYNGEVKITVSHVDTTYFTYDCELSYMNYRFDWLALGL